jgi:hypothetical protein
VAAALNAGKRRTSRVEIAIWGGLAVYDREMKKIYGAAVVIVVGLLSLATLYVVSYAVLLEPQSVYLTRHGVICRIPTPTYRLGGEAAEAVYQPLHRLDCWLRPGTWEANEVQEIPPGVGGFF